MGRTIHELRGVRGQERKDYHAKIAQTFDANLSADAAALDDGSFLGGKYRASDSLGTLPDATLQALDGLLEAHGLALVLKGLRELLDGRAGGGEFAESFELEEERDATASDADALETLLAQLARRSDR